ncbi:hypothetical protein IKF92_02430 [Candidatus Saccharibacteria bacterium]|nr:hypothetical protein [Candidatus Saccharibacteria bacterium]
MFFDELSLIPEIALKCGTAIFVVPKDFKLELKNAYVLQPEEKKTITIQQVRELLAKLGLKQTNDQIIVIDRVESMNEEAANALLKTLEEPQEKTHFILLTSEISAILPTILSRSEIYFYREKLDFDKISVDEKTKNLAKRLLVAKNSDLPGLADEITARKKREDVLIVLDAAIQMLYKAYFSTKKPIFLAKLTKFLTVYERILQNGHLKLQIIANLC